MHGCRVYTVILDSLCIQPEASPVCESEYRRLVCKCCLVADAATKLSWHTDNDARLMCTNTSVFCEGWL